MSWDWATLISLTVAVVSTGINVWVVRSQLALQLAEIKSNIDDSVIAWGERAIGAVAEAEFLASRCAGPDVGLDEDLRIHAASLSALADAGRLFFPNEAPKSQGADRAGAFQGVRPPILDAIVFSCILLTQLRTLPPEKRAERTKDASRFLNRCRRLVVTELQNAVDPRQKEVLLKQMRRGRLDDHPSPYALAKELGVDFDKAYPNHPVMKSWIDTHVHGINQPSKEPPANDFRTRFHRLVWGVGDHLVRSSERALRQPRHE